MKQFWDYMESISTVYYNEIRTIKMSNNKENWGEGDPTLSSIQKNFNLLNTSDMKQKMDNKQKKEFMGLHKFIKQIIERKNKIIGYQNDLGISNLFFGKKLEKINRLDDPEIQNKWEASDKCDSFSSFPNADGPTEQSKLASGWNPAQKKIYQKMMAIDFIDPDSDSVQIDYRLEELIKELKKNK